MKMKTSELTGHALDWAVARCEGIEFEVSNGGIFIPDEDGVDAPYQYSPSRSYNDAGWIIDREDIDLRYRVGVNMTATINGQFEQTVGYREVENPQLVVAMRCYVASKLGDEVEIPDELTRGESND